ncbi:MAG TPA: PAS domain-containing protein [Ideonella sp.]|nr:PAS domain-containing protein [Ideonella sp.]
MPKPADLHRWGLVEQVAGFAVWDLDVPAQQVLYSPQWKGWLGYPAEDSADPVETWRSRVHPDDLGAMVQALSTHIDGQEPSYEHEFRLRAADGAYRRVLSRGQVVARDGHGAALRAVGTLTDLGKRRQAQEARQPAHGPVDGDGVSDAQRQFWLRVSHEFRTPLNAVLGFSQLLATRLGADDLPTQRLYLAHVEKAGWQLLKLVEEAMAEGGHPASTPAGLADRALPGTDESPGG